MNLPFPDEMYLGAGMPFPPSAGLAITTLLQRNRQHSFDTNDMHIRYRFSREPFTSQSFVVSSSFTQKVHYGCPVL